MEMFAGAVHILTSSKLLNWLLQHKSCIMENRDHSRHPFEPATDELPSKQRYHFTLDRRKFFKLSGGGLVVAFVLNDLISLGNDSISPPDPSQPDSVDAWIHIDEDGTVNVFTGKVEVGQNIRTSLSQTVAEELMVPVSSITMIMGDTDLVPYDAGTFGSRSTPQMGTQLRKAAATAREGRLCGISDPRRVRRRLRDGLLREPP